MTALVLRSDARRLPLADSSVDLVVTSPPYFALRSYTDGGQTYDGQVGAEGTPIEFVDTLLAVTAECARVLKPSGSIWVNLGDKYAERSGPERPAADQDDPRYRKAARPLRRTGGFRPKSLMGIPWRYALGCIDQLGLILRAEVIWAKPNGLPEPVTDRVRRSHETWFHFTKEPRYFSGVDEIREPHSDVSIKRAMPHRSDPGRRGAEVYGNGMAGQTLSLAQMNHPLGKLPGSVWTVPTSPLVVPEVLGVDHFAAFPPEWPKRIIQGWSPTGICAACGEGRRPVSTTDPGVKERETPAYCDSARHGKSGSTLGSRGPTAKITGYVCACPEPTADTRPAVVLDCFGGTGTTAMVAKALGRVGVSVDLSADYCRLAQWRTQDLAQIAKVRDEPFRKPTPQVEGQEDLFGGAA